MTKAIHFFISSGSAALQKFAQCLMLTAKWLDDTLFIFIFILQWSKLKVGGHFISVKKWPELLGGMCYWIGLLQCFYLQTLEFVKYTEMLSPLKEVKILFVKFKSKKIVMIAHQLCVATRHSLEMQVSGTWKIYVCECWDSSWTLCIIRGRDPWLIGKKTHLENIL